MRFQRILLILFVLLAAGVPRVFGASAPIPEEDYWTLVAQTQAEIRTMEGKPAEEVRLALDGLAGSWSQLSEVQRADGSVITVDSSFLVAALLAEPPDLERLDGLLGALLEAHESHPQAVFAPTDLDSLNVILSQPEFQWRTNPVNDWFQKMWNKIAAWLDKFLQPLNISISIPGGGNIMTVIAVIVLLAVLAFVFRGLFTDLVKEAKGDGTDEDSDINLTAETAFRKAQNLSGQGDYRTAVRYLYLSSLLMMEERGILRYDRSRTNREYLRSVSEHPNLAKPLKTVVDVFDRTWYGFEPLDESTYKEYVNEVEELKEQKE